MGQGSKFAKLGEGYLEQARVWLRMGRRALRDRNYAFTVLAAQECVEFSLKGALRKLGIEHPRFHDVGQVLVLNRERLPEGLVLNLDRVMDVSRRLVMKRSQAAYGDEAGGVPPGRLFDRAAAVSALADASWVLELCSKTKPR